MFPEDSASNGCVDVRHHGGIDIPVYKWTGKLVLLEISGLLAHSAVSDLQNHHDLGVGHTNVPL